MMEERELIRQLQEQVKEVKRLKRKERLQRWLNLFLVFK